MNSAIPGSSGLKEIGHSLAQSEDHALSKAQIKGLKSMQFLEESSRNWQIATQTACSSALCPLHYLLPDI